MAAPAGCRFWGLVSLVLCGPLVIGSAAAPVRRAADSSTAAVVPSRADAQRDVGAGPQAIEDSQDKEVVARRGGGDGEPSSAEAFVQKALEADAAGKSAEREHLLRKALKIDPECASARWHLGYIRVGKEWVAWDEIQRRAAVDPRLAEYRRRFDEQAGTPAGELALARWCRDQGLDEHARFHWMRLIGFQPQNEEALKAVGVRWYRGQLLTHEQILAARRGQNAQAQQEPQAHRKDWARHWAPRVTKWQRMVQEDDAALDSSIREELQALGKPAGPDFWAALQGLDSVLMLRSQWPKDAEAYHTLSLKWIQIVSNMSDPRATDSLVRLAVDHPVRAVRAAAADALKTRPKHLYVSKLIARMGTLIEARFSLTPLPLGGAIYEQSLFREGADSDYEVVQSHSVLAGGSGPRLDSPPPPGYRQTDNSRSRDSAGLARQLQDEQANMARATMKAGVVAAGQSAATQRRVDQANTSIQETNERVQAALSRATGVDFGVHPRPWLDWWVATCSDHFDVERPSQTPDSRPVSRDYRYAEERSYLAPRATTAYDAPPAPPAPPPPPPRAVPPRPSGTPYNHPWHFNRTVWDWQCCFPRHTVVWSLSGPMPIDQVKAGDRVLSQHPVTGELAYKPVIATTTRKPPSLTRVSLGSEVLSATRGHPFLVAGEGWKMAKQLKVGMRLHSLAGSALIDGVEEVAELKPFYERLAEEPNADANDDLAYNLIVDESHTYFVGQKRVLVFDNMFAALANPTLGTAVSAK